MRRALIIASLDSTPTVFTYYFAHEVYGWLKEKGFEVNTLFNWMANRVAYSLTNTKVYDWIIYTGHGTKGGWVGQLELMPLLGLLQDRNNAQKLQDRVVFTFCCLGYYLARYVPAKIYFGSSYLMYIALPTSDHNYARDMLDLWFTLLESYYESLDPFYALKQYKEFGKELMKIYYQNKWYAWDVYYRAVQKNTEYYNVLVREYEKPSPTPIQPVKPKLKEVVGSAPKSPFEKEENP